jgi:hypothetical protein
MPDPDRFTPASSEDLADALAFALRYSGRKRTHDASEMLAATSSAPASFAAFHGRSPDAATAEDLRLFQQHMTKATRLGCPSEAANPQLQPVARPLSCPRAARSLVVGLLIA